MAIITCPECGRQISEYAPACVGCVVPMEMIKKLLAESENGEKTAEGLTTHLNKKTEDKKKTREMQKHSIILVFHMKRAKMLKRIKKKQRSCIAKPQIKDILLPLIKSPDAI